MEQKNVSTGIQELVIDIDELKDHSLVIYRLQWWELVLGKVIIHKSRSALQWRKTQLKMFLSVFKIQNYFFKNYFIFFLLSFYVTF